MLTLIVPNSYAKHLDQKRLSLAWEVSLKQLKLPTKASATLRITNNALIRQFNLNWRDENAVTDVLSFENAYTDPETGEEYLGDIIISFQKAKQQAQLGGHPVQTEIEMLFVHGILHLVGYDHGDKEEWQAMTDIQNTILEKIANPLQSTIQYNE